MSALIQKQLNKLGFECLDVTLIGHGGQLNTYQVSVLDKKTSQKKEIVAKYIQQGRDIAAIYGYSSDEMLRREAEYTSLLNKHHLGPKLLSNRDGFVIRDYFEGNCLADILAEHEGNKASSYLDLSLDFLENLLRIIAEENEYRFLDFHLKNLLVSKDGKFSLIDHEWAVIRFKTHEDLCVFTLYKYARDLLKNTSLTVDQVLYAIMKNAYLAQYIERLTAQLVSGYYNVNDSNFQKKIMNNGDIIERLELNRCQGSPYETLLLLCSRLKDRSIRYCFARRYDRLWQEKQYREKDIDLYVHPDDFYSFMLEAQESGFTLYNFTKFMCYCCETGQVLFLDVDLVGYGSEHAAFDVRKVVGNSEERNNLYFIRDVDFGAQIVVNAVRLKKALKNSYREFLLKLMGATKESDSYIEAALTPFVGAKQAVNVKRWILAGDWEKVEKLSLLPSMQVASHVTPKRRMFDKLIEGPRLVAMLGVDGAGKSTTTNAVKAALECTNQVVKDYYLGCYYPPSGRGQAFVLPTDALMVTAFKVLNMARGLGLAPKKLTTASSSPQKFQSKEFHYNPQIDDKPWIAPLEPGGECASIIFRFYAWLLMLDCFLMGVKLRLVGGAGFVFTDRYFYDLITFLGPRNILSKWVSLLFPPDAAIFLYASAETQAAREPRHPLSEIRRNQELYRLVPRINPKVNWHEISTELPKEVVIQRVLFLCMTAPRQRSLVKFLGNVCAIIINRFRLVLPSLRKT